MQAFLFLSVRFYSLSHFEVTFNNSLRFKGKVDGTLFFCAGVYTQVCFCIFGSVAAEIMAIWLFADGEYHTQTHTHTPTLCL